ncbi:hypothetical protein PHMEG_00028586 [Phytophthora megakarya]|uniref:Uncharacterized protein n=1 Tax=Phytophthora megakarya TaxID=4795 RepID=A0A225V4K5_9STRA|nr:hypothetical protein PHMEG_00028586 [Phytophthora megakarya]
MQVPSGSLCLPHRITPTSTLSSCSPRRTNLTNRLRIVTKFAPQAKRHAPPRPQRYRIDVLGLQETRPYTLDKRNIGSYTLLTRPATQEFHGIGFAISPRIRPYLDCFWAPSDRIGVIQLKLPHAGPVAIITAYAPHSGRPLTEVDRFTILSSKSSTSYPDATPRDFITKLGQRNPGETYMGPHARGVRNRNGHVLADFCSAHKLFSTHTGFQKRARHKTTWSQRQTNHCIYNQIDYILCPQNCRSLCKDAQSWGGALTASDHKLVTADFVLDAATHRVRFRNNVHQRQETSLRLSRDRLIHDEATRTQYAEALKQALSQADTSPKPTVLQRWEDTFQQIHAVAEEVTGFSTTANRRQRYQDPELQQLSKTQRDLQLRIYNDITADSRSMQYDITPNPQTMP